MPHLPLPALPCAGTVMALVKLLRVFATPDHSGAERGRKQTRKLHSAMLIPQPHRWSSSLLSCLGGPASTCAHISHTPLPHFCFVRHGQRTMAAKCKGGREVISQIETDLNPLVWWKWEPQFPHLQKERLLSLIRPL